jgi:hypothetical protein
MKAKAPKTAMGVPRSTLKGRDQLSYWAARIKKTKRNDIPKITPMDTPSLAYFSW